MSARVSGSRPILQSVVEHFVARANHYDCSSRWCSDDAMLDSILRLIAPSRTDEVLDVACGTGLVGGRFKGSVGRVVGVDLTREMSQQATARLDEVVVGSAEALPFEEGSFDLVVSRQGIQFMEDRKAVREMVRVLRPGGRVCLIQLCAYGSDDRDEYFEVLRLRNPARRNFYVPDDIRALLEGAGCVRIGMREYVSVEDVEAWADNRAIGETSREAIRHLYLKASEPFRRLHGITWNADETVSDHMLFAIAIGTKP